MTSIRLIMGAMRIVMGWALLWFAFYYTVTMNKPNHFQYAVVIFLILIYAEGAKR